MKKRSRPMSGRNHYNDQDDNGAFNHRSLEKAKATRQHYLDLAKEMIAQGDRIAAENCYQFADHYTRIINEANRRAIKPRLEINNHHKPEMENHSAEAPKEIVKVEIQEAAKVVLAE